MTRDQVDEYYLTVAEVAELLRLNQQTVRNWIDQGSLPALRVGRRVRIKQSDLDRLLSDGYSAGTGAPGEGPSAEDFWGGEPVGIAETAAANGDSATSEAMPAAANGDLAASEAMPAATNGDSAAGEAMPAAANGDSAASGE